jgi:replication factor A1
MKISELNAGQGNIDVTVEVISIEEPREFDKYGKKLKVANATIKDDSGEIKMTLWNDDIEKVKEGMTLHITNGYCSEFKDEKQITTGKFGKFEVL